MNSFLKSEMGGKLCEDELLEMREKTNAISIVLDEEGGRIFFSNQRVVSSVVLTREGGVRMFWEIVVCVYVARTIFEKFEWKCFLGNFVILLCVVLYDSEESLLPSF